MFASPYQIGRLPYSYAGVWGAFRRAAAEAGIGHVSWHAFRPKSLLRVAEDRTKLAKVR
jgi:hypothetical protein